MSIQYIKGDLINLAKEGAFDVIAHGVNCFTTQTKGIAKSFSEEFNTTDPTVYRLESPRLKGDINKLGQIEYRYHILVEAKVSVPAVKVMVVNAYIQYKYGTSQINVDYDALRLCMRKLNHRFAGQKLGIPTIGSGLAGGDWSIIERIIKQELKDCVVTVVVYDKPKPKEVYETEVKDGVKT